MAEEMPKVKRTFYTVIVKRLLDIILSGISIVLLSPLMLILSILELIYHGRPVLFAQERPGFEVASRPIYKPMSMQPVYRNNEHFTLDGAWRLYESFRSDTFWLRCDRARQYYESGICLPSDVGMTAEEQDKIIDIIYACYDKADLNRLAWA